MTLNQFLSKISTKERNKELDILELKESAFPVVLYGIGDYAKTLYNFLEKRGVRIDYAAVDDNHYQDSINLWNNLPIISINDLKKKSAETHNIIIGFSKYKEAFKNLEQFKNINKIYFFDSLSFFTFFDYNFIVKNLNSFFQTYNYLEDSKSKNVYLAFINGKLTGFPDDLYELVEGDQYCPQDIIVLSDDEVFVDAGAYTGDTLANFLKLRNGMFKHYYAFEPDVLNFNKLKDSFAKEYINRIDTYNMGVFHDKGELRFKSDIESTVKSSFSESGDLVVQVDSIDNILNGSPATYIKMDIEGSEEHAILGAQNTIKNFKPKLAISSYHKKNDLIVIPQLIKSLRPDYKLYLRHHLHITQELVLYAI